jgi:hypothetical protein
MSIVHERIWPHLPPAIASFGRGWPTRSYSNEVSPDLTFRTVFRDSLRWTRSTSNRPRPREQRAIDLRIEARMAFSPFGKTAEWLDLRHDAEARSKKIGDKSKHLASTAVKVAALNFYGTRLMRRSLQWKKPLLSPTGW